MNLLSAADTGYGAYVYMLLCQSGEDDAVYLKIGQSSSPTKRLQDLIYGCGLKAEVFSFTDVGYCHRAKQLENALLLACKPWQTRGEWFRIPLAEKQTFNFLLREVCDTVAKKWHWESDARIKWEKVMVDDVAKAWRSNAMKKLHFLKANRAA